MDSYDGDEYEPLSLHKYLYTYADPVDNVDHCGYCLPSTTTFGNLVQQLIFQDFQQQTGSNLFDTSINNILGLNLSSFKGGTGRPDLIDTTTFNTVGQVYEIKSVYSEALGLAEVTAYAAVLSRFDKQRTWIPGFTYLPTPLIPVGPSTLAIVSRPYPGVITYCLIDQRELLSMAFAAGVAGLSIEVGATIMTSSMAYGAI